MNEEIISRIKLVIRVKNISQNDIATAIGISAQTFSNILKSGNPTLENFIRIISYFKDINLNWMLFGEGKMDLPDTDIGLVNESNINYNGEVQDYNLLRKVWEKDRAELETLRKSMQEITNTLIDKYSKLCEEKKKDK